MYATIGNSFLSNVQNNSTFQYNSLRWVTTTTFQFSMQCRGKESLEDNLTWLLAEWEWRCFSRACVCKEGSRFRLQQATRSKSKTMTRNSHHRKIGPLMSIKTSSYRLVAHQGCLYSTVHHPCPRVLICFFHCFLRSTRTKTT